MVKLITAMLIASLSLFADGHGGDKAPQMQTKQIEVSQKQIKQFVAANMAVSEVRNTLMKELSQGVEKGQKPSKEKMKQFQQEFQSEAQTAIEGEDMSMETYIQISKKFRQDKAFQQKVQQAAQEMMQ